MQTSENLVLNEVTERTDYLMYTSTFLEDGIFPVLDYLQNDSFIEDFDISILSNGLFNTENKSEDYRYFPPNNQEDPNDPVIVTHAIVTNLRGFQKLQSVLSINGSVPTNQNQILISQPLINEISEKIDLDLNINSELNISIARRFPITDMGQDRLRHFNKLDFTNFNVTGIFQYKGVDSTTANAYSDQIFSRLVIFPLENFEPLDIIMMNHNGMRPNAMLNIKKEIILDYGVRGLRQLMIDLSDRIKSRFWFSYSYYLQDTVSLIQREFTFAFNSVFYYLPLIGLSFLLSNFAINVFIKDRKIELDKMRLKGAENSLLARLLGTEFLIITIIGILIGIPVSLILASIIPSLRLDKVIDFEFMQSFIQQINLSFTLLYLLIIIVFGIFGISSIYHIITTVYYDSSKDLQTGIDFASVALKIFTLITSIGVILLIIELNEASLKIQSFSSDIQFFLLIIILIINLLWFLYTHYLTKLLFKFLSSISFLFIEIFPQTAYIVQKNIRRTYKNLSTLTFFIILFISLTTFSLTLDATYMNYQEESDQFLQGAPLRIHTEETSDLFSQTLEEISGVKEVTPIYKNFGRIVSTDMTVYAVDAESYLDVAYWQYAKGISDPTRLVKTLNSNESNILISEEISNRLGYDLEDEIFLTSFEGRYVDSYTVTGIIHSAPGLGLSASANPEVSQTTRGWVMVSLDYVKSQFNISDTNIFLGSIESNVDIDDLIQEIDNLPEVTFVNPKPINQNFVGLFIEDFLPRPRILLRFVTFVSFVISFFIFSMNTDYILKQRKREYSLLIVIGGSKNKVIKSIIQEFSIITVFSLILGMIFGLIMARSAMSFFVPFTLKQLLLDLEFVIPWGSIALLIFLGFLEIFGVILNKIRDLIIKDPLEGFLD